MLGASQKVVDYLVLSPYRLDQFIWKAQALPSASQDVPVWFLFSTKVKQTIT